MVDVVSTGVRSRMMAGIKGKNTRPEMRVRRYLHGAGLRFRVHVRDLPGSPDLVFTRYRVAIFVHGCFWHRHPGCHYAAIPATRTTFWREKLDRNVARDSYVEAELHALGWTVIIAWECDIRSDEFLDQLFWRVVCQTQQNE